MDPRGAARVVAALVVFGLVAGFGSTYLLQAGLPGWVVLVLVVLVVAVPVVAASRSSRRDG